MKRPHVLHFIPLMLAALFLTSCGEDETTQPEVCATGDPTLNESTWLSNGFDSYSYRFRWECFCTDTFTRTVDILVIRCKIVAITDVSTGDLLEKNIHDRYRTIEGLFDFLQEARDQNAASIIAEYDSTLGYPSVVYVDYDEGLADEEMGFRIYGLSPLR